MLVVTKMGGKVLRGNLPQIADDIKAFVSKAENKIVLVHGGGIEVTAIAQKFGVPPKFVVSPEGFRSRYTDKETIEIYNMVMSGKINKHVVSTLQSRGIQSVGLSGADGSLLKAKRKSRIVIVDERNRKKVIDGGFTGKVEEVNTQLLITLINSGYVPVIAPVAISENYELLNVDGDRAAAQVAGALKADKFILLTDVEGVLLNGKPIQKINVSEAKETLPKIGAGMITKVYAAVEALNLGAKEAIIVSGLIKTPISSAINHESGTVITNE
ncbi:MAG: [LysW]-aminoadipate/[LysW]-glutamate kinase [Candidatus Bathyarchaeia archaeon]